MPHKISIWLNTTLLPATQLIDTPYKNMIGKILDNLVETVKNGDINLDASMVSAAHDGKSKGINATHLAKVYKMDIKQRGEPLT